MIRDLREARRMLNAGGLGSGLVEVRRGLTRPLPLHEA
jgi:hypothetical protein